VWIDATCGRATTVEFARLGHPFIDGAVQAWHEGENITAPGDFKTELRRTGAAVREAARAAAEAKMATYASAADHTRAVNEALTRWHTAVAARRIAIQRAYLCGMSNSEIGRECGVGRSTVQRDTRGISRG